MTGSQEKESNNDRSGKKEGMTFEEYALKDAPSDFIEICEHYKGKNEDIKNYLTSCKDSGAISQDAYIVYYNYYRK